MRPRRNGLGDNSFYIWPEGRVPYLIGSGFTESQVGLIREAVAEYNRVFDGCVQWTERSGIEVSGFAGSVPVFLDEFKENFFGESELFWRLHLRLMYLYLEKACHQVPTSVFFAGNGKRDLASSARTKEKNTQCSDKVGDALGLHGGPAPKWKAEGGKFCSSSNPFSGPPI